MSFGENLVKARSHIAFIIGLICAAGVAMSVETGIAKNLGGRGSTSLITRSSEQTMLASVGGLSRQDIRHAEIAWDYFEKNTQPETGLVNSVNNYPSTTIWDQASYLLGLISAHRIQLITTADFDTRMTKVLRSLADLPLFDGALPNKAYDTRSLEMTDYENKPMARGIGWSALDVARISVPLNLILYDYPRHSNAAAKILGQWRIAEMLENGVLVGARVNPETGETERVQEGRLGYEEYGARAVSLLGLDALTAARYDDFLQFQTVAGVSVAVDSRSFAEFDAHNYVVSEPYILTAIEFGFDTNSQELAHRIFTAQRQRYDQTGILTAVSEDNINQEPYFLYNTVFANGKAWNALAEDGSEHPEKRTVSTKAVFGWDALYGTEYTGELMSHILQTATEGSGWQSGVYEIDGSVNAVSTANTNAIILEALQYKANGPLLAARFNRKGS